MSNPVLVEVVRGKLVESRHTGSIAVVDADGLRALTVGDVQRLIYPRSAIKPIQALPLIESGAADRYGFGAEELALACASHGGEPGHVAVVSRMLAVAGLDSAALKCGVHWPLYQPAGHALAAGGGQASALHNNCSGKHAGFLCTACALEAEPASYIEATHPVQREVKAALEGLTGAGIPDEARGIDGCSAPNWAMPLEALACAFARFGTGHGLSPKRAEAVARLRAACAEHPWHMAGTGRFCTTIMQAFRSRLFVKTGAEGVLCAALPERGLGIAVKCDDGAGRAAEVMLAAAIARFMPSDADTATLARFARPVLRNWNRIVVGELRPTKALSRS